MIALCVPDQYEVLERIGKGGMGIVFKARNRFTDRIVAIKVLKQDEFSHADQERFKREAKAASAFRHANAVQVLDFGVCNQSPYLVMEYVGGVNLDAFLKARGKMTERGSMQIAKQIGAVLSAAHGAGVVHRDLKPSNIMIQASAEGQLRAIVLDFGLAKLTNVKTNDQLTKTGDTMGTPQYMSPEQFQGTAADARSDIYSLGAVLYQCCTGNPPHEGDTPYSTMYKVFNSEPTPFLRQEGEQPSSFEHIIFRCLERSLDDRYQTVASLIEDLERVDRGDSPCFESTKTEPDGRLESKKARAFFPVGLLVSSVASVAVLTSVGSFFILQHTHAPSTKAPAVSTASSAITPGPLRSDQKFIAFVKAEPNLTQLTVPDDISDSALAEVASLKELDTLTIHNSYVHKFSFLSKLPRIRFINFSQSNMRMDSSAWATLASLPTLKGLGLDGIIFDEKDIAGLAGSKTLHTLVISRTSINRPTIEQITRIKTLDVLGISQCKFSHDDDLDALIGSKITALDLGYNAKVGDETIEKIVRSLPKLQVLFLRQLPITDKAMEAIATLKDLRDLEIGQTKLTDAGIKKITALKQLRQLDTYQLPLTDAAIVSISLLPKLHDVYLEHTSITDASIPKFKHMKALSVLDITNTNISPKGIKELGDMSSMKLLYTSLGGQPATPLTNKQCLVVSDGKGIPSVNVMRD